MSFGAYAGGRGTGTNFGAEQFVGLFLPDTWRYPYNSLALDSEEVRNYIQDSGITQTGHLGTDFRSALYSALTAPRNPSEHDYSIQDVYKEVWEQENP